MIIFQTPPCLEKIFYLCATAATPSAKCKTGPDPTQKCVYANCLHAYVSLCWFSCVYVSFFLQRDLLFHVDWRGWQQEVWVLQTPAGKPLLNLSLSGPLLPAHTLLSPVCCDRHVNMWYGFPVGTLMCCMTVRCGSRKENIWSKEDKKQNKTACSTR